VNQTDPFNAAAFFVDRHVFSGFPGFGLDSFDE
jgi:hypothetical protein